MLHTSRYIIPLALTALWILSGCSGPTEPKELPRAEQPAADESPIADARPPAEAAVDDDPAEPAPQPEPKAVENTESTTVAKPQPPADDTPQPAIASQPKTIPSDSTRATAASVNRRPIELSFDDIKFDIEPGDPFEPEMIPEDIRKYYGKRIRIRGYILPSFKQTGLTQFVLVRDNMECCFGPGAALYDCIRVEMEPGKATEFSIRPVAVEGIFNLEEFYGPDGKHLAIYYMTGEAVQ